MYDMHINIIFFTGWFKKINLNSIDRFKSFFFQIETIFYAFPICLLTISNCLIPKLITFPLYELLNELIKCLEGYCDSKYCWFLLASVNPTKLQ